MSPKDKVEPSVEALAQQDQRIEAILGEAYYGDFAEAVEVFFKYLQKHLQLPCEVHGIKHFDWEERYAFDGDSPKEYARLKKTRPSYTDAFEILEIERSLNLEWMVFGEEDIAVHVRRKSDGKTFDLGLSELEVVDKTSPNHQLVADYAGWFVNNCW